MALLNNAWVNSYLDALVRAHEGAVGVKSASPSCTSGHAAPETR